MSHEPASRLERYGNPQAIRPAKPPYLALLGGVFVYPFSSASSVGVLLLGAVFFALGFLFVGYSGIFGIPALLILAGALVGYYFHVMQDSGTGSREAPGWPDLTDVWGYLADFFRWVATFVAAFLPAGIVYVAVVGIGGPVKDLSSGTFALFAGTLCFGAFYAPMALMLGGFGNSWSAPFHYLQGLRSMWRLGFDYVACAFLCGAVQIVQSLLAAWIERMSTGSLLLRVPAEIAIMAVALAIGMIQMRALGLLYFAREDDLGWFR